MADNKTESKVTANALYFDGSDDSKWDAWAFKMLAYAAKKKHKKAFTTKFVFGPNEAEWTEVEKANKVLMEGAWSQIAMVVQGHALKSVIKVTSENSKEAWDKLEAEFEPCEITDVVSLNNDFTKMTLEIPTEDPTDCGSKGSNSTTKELARSNQGN
jgi:hypothetical protein